MNPVSSKSPGVRVLHVPASLAGWGACALLAGAGAWAASEKLADHLLWYGALTLCLMAAFSLLTLTIGALWIRRELMHMINKPPQPLIMECGIESLLPDCVPGSQFWPPVSVATSWHEPCMVRQRHHHGHEYAEPAARGWHESIKREIRIEDPARMTTVTFESITAGPVMVLPAKKCVVGGLLELPMLRGDSQPVAGAMRHGDPLDLREYQEGDSARRIVWRIVAQTGGAKYVTRTPEESATVSRAYFFLSAAGDESGAELARCIVEEEHSASWWLAAAGANGNAASGMNRQEALALVCRSIAGQHQSVEELAQDLGKFKAELQRRAPGAVLVIAGQPEVVSTSWTARVKLTAKLLRELSPVMVVARPAGALPQSAAVFEDDFSAVWEVELAAPGGAEAVS
ncbi:MAG: DUF58 domain-containing protein [Verrucomicrobium sp.]